MKENDWINIFENDNRNYNINLDACALAHYISTWKKYAPKEEQKDAEIDLMYETLFGGYYEYTNEEKELIKKKTIKILNNKSRVNIKYKILESLIKDNSYFYNDIARFIGYTLNDFINIINGHDELTYKEALLLSSIFHMTPDDVFYSEFKKEMKKRNSID